MSDLPPAPSPDTAIAIRAWYDRAARDLPWRRPDATAWEVLVSEFMLQQTPVARVLPVWQQWIARWPAPSTLAAAAPGEAVRAWGRLGYPRRALRLHAAAAVIEACHDGAVPAEVEHLRALPGVGDYTAAAVAAFAFRRRTVVLDSNVRRVLARLAGGVGQPPAGMPARAERERAESLLPYDGHGAARWSVGLMELGALVCTARSPRCHGCPVSDRCAWLALGSPLGDAPPRTQTYAGTDRQCRGRLLARLRDSEGPVAAQVLERAWDEPVQRARALDGLVADGLVEPTGDDAYALPGTVSA